MPLRHLISSVVAVLLLAGAGRADMPVFYSNGGAAIGGYDTVAYFLSGTAVRGRPQIAVQWKGVLWHFSTRANRETFESNPRAYAPQYGGYCAYGVSRGHAVATDPEAWQIIDGKLYLIHSHSVLQMWVRDPQGNIALGEANWPAVLSK